MGYPPVAYQYTGPSWLNGGCTVVFNDAGLGLPSTGAPVNLNGGTVVGNGTMTLEISMPIFDGGRLRAQFKCQEDDREYLIR